MKIEIIEVMTTAGRSKWIVRLNGRAIGNYWTKAGAERRAREVSP